MNTSARFVARATHEAVGRAGTVAALQRRIARAGRHDQQDRCIPAARLFIAEHGLYLARADVVHVHDDKREFLLLRNARQAGAIGLDQLDVEGAQ
jgi:hypothetical protein